MIFKFFLFVIFVQILASSYLLIIFDNKSISEFLTGLSYTTTRLFTEINVEVLISTDYVNDLKTVSLDYKQKDHEKYINDINAELTKMRTVFW